jgi:hypothetical protein
MTPAGRRRRALVDAVVQVTALGGFVGAWELIVRLLGVPRSIVPAPSVIGAELLQIHGLIASWGAYTMTTALEGYALAVAGGVVLAIVLESSPALERGLFPFFVASQAVPIIAFSAVVILWLGNGPLSKVTIAFYLSFFPITVSAVKGLQSCDPAAVALLRTFGAGRAQVLWKLRMPVVRRQPWDRHLHPAGSVRGGHRAALVRHRHLRSDGYRLLRCGDAHRASVPLVAGTRPRLTIGSVLHDRLGGQRLPLLTTSAGALEVPRCL